MVASDKNNVLYDFLTTGVYDRNRPFFTTTSPSMDILISSNLERMLYYLSGGDCELIARLMADLAETGRFEVPAELLAKIQETFACGYRVQEKLPAAAGSTARVLLSTASPYKFPRAVLEALGEDVPADDFACMRKLEEVTGTTAPAQLAALESAHERFSDVVDVAGMGAHVENAALRL